MKVLLDECLPRKLKLDVDGEVVKTVPEMGWAGIENGELLRLAEAEFDVFLTRDRNLEYQQNLKKFALAIIVLVARSNDIDDLRPLIPATNEALGHIRAHEVQYVRG